MATQLSSTVASLVITKIGDGLYSYAVEVAQQELFSEAGFDTITQALSDAGANAAAFIGCEVTYSGIVAGTFSPAELVARGEEVAQLCVENAARFAGG